MANKTLKFEDFEAEKLTRTEQKIVRGGDGGPDDPPYDPGKGKGGNGDEEQTKRISITTISL